MAARGEQQLFCASLRQLAALRALADEQLGDDDLSYAQIFLLAADGAGARAISLDLERHGAVVATYELADRCDRWRSQRLLPLTGPRHAMLCFYRSSGINNPPNYNSERITTSMKPSRARPKRISGYLQCAAAALISALLQVGVVRAAPPPPRFADAPCPFAIPKGASIRCGTLAVPEDRARPNGRIVRLPVAIASAPQAPGQADPVLYLAGGPGSAALTSTPSLVRGWASFLQHRDLIVVDQRGTGRAQPSLDCPEADAAHKRLRGTLAGADARRTTEHAALVACGQRLARAGVSIAAYTTEANAADMRDLRVALGYRQWNVFGISYGTRLAMELARVDAEGTRSLVLDSVYPPQVNLFTAMPGSFNAALCTLFDANVGLKVAFYALVDQLQAKPITVQAHDPRTNAAVAMQVDGRELLELTYAMLHTTAELALLPAMITGAASGHYAPLAAMESRRLAREGAFAEAMYYAVECGSDLARTTPAATSAAVGAFPHLAPYFAAIQEFSPGAFDLCARWGTHSPAPESYAPLASNVPTLILAGANDPITPPAWAQLAATTLPHSEVYTFAATGHAVITRGGCAYGLVAGFLDTFSARASAGCVR